ncbi:hypothetical protein [Streptomyces sp. NPDC056628]|uniref:hypothetical protein n=1 Tax=Streptomyces sp. NPDC056628 TaxID=3345882 RepID=UPI0036961A58
MLGFALWTGELTDLSTHDQSPYAAFLCALRHPGGRAVTPQEQEEQEEQEESTSASPGAKQPGQWAGS